VFLGEHYSLTTWVGAGIITLGIAVTIAAQRTDR
jgi:drug/metabolite transporter (DMT)-like permease